MFMQSKESRIGEGIDEKKLIAQISQILFSGNDITLEEHLCILELLEEVE